MTKQCVGYGDINNIGINGFLFHVFMFLPSYKACKHPMICKWLIFFIDTVILPVTKN